MNQDLDFFKPQEKTLGELIATYTQPESSSPEKCVILSGFPYDEGTKRNGGRVGGAVASAIVRSTLKQRQLYLHTKIPVYDALDIDPQNQLEKAHEQLTKKQQNILRSYPNGVLMSIGGSNDQSYCNVLALMQAYPEAKIGVINLDSHFDVRPLNKGKAHSGSPFRLMLQHPTFIKNSSKFIEFAVKGATCSNQHYKFLKSKDCQVYWMEKDIRMLELTKQSRYRTQAGQLFQRIMLNLQKQTDIIFVSFDLDCISSKFMPGVSAPSVIGGIEAQQAIEILRISGFCKKVKIIDFSEFNPAVESILSSRMVTQMIYHGISAYSQSDLS